MKNGVKPVRRMAALLAALSCACLANAGEPQLRVGLSGECPSAYSGKTVKPKVAPIVAAIAASLAAQTVTSLIGKLNQYLTTEKSVNIQDTYPAEALLITNADQALVFSPDANCVWVAVAEKFHTPHLDSKGLPQQGAEAATPEKASAAVPFPVTNKLAIVDFTGVESSVLFYYEAKFEQPANKGGWRIAPQTTFYPKFLHSSNVFQSSTHDLSLTIQFALPGKNDSPFATYNLALPGLSEGELTTEMVASKGTGWLATPPTATYSNGKPAFFPVNVTAQLIETRKPNELAMALGKVATDKTSDLSSLANAKVLYALSEDARADARTTATTAATTANEAYNKAYDAAKAAYDAYDAVRNSTDTAARNRTLNNAAVAYSTLALAKDDAQKKMGAAGLSFQPLPDLPPIS